MRSEKWGKDMPENSEFKIMNYRKLLRTAACALVLLLAAFCLPPSAFATTVTGKVTDSTGTAVSGAAVNFRLINIGRGNIARVTGTSIVAPALVSASSAADGTFTATITGNDQITPAGTLYEVVIRGPGFTYGPFDYSITGPAADLDSLTPSATFANTPSQVSPAAMPALTGDATSAAGTAATSVVGLHFGATALSLGTAPSDGQCLTRSGLAITGAACGGSANAFQVNAVNLSASSTVNFQNSAATNGLTLNFSNPSAGNVQLGLSGALANAGLANSSVTVNGQAVSLGASGNIPFSVNGSNDSTLTGLNAVTSTANAVGLTVTPSNPSGNNWKFEITGGSYTGNAATATALAAVPAQCPANQFAAGIAASGAANCLQPGFTNLSGSATASQLPATINASAIQDKGGQVYNVKAYGVVGNGVFLYTGSITTGTAALTVTGGSFAAGDVGKPIEVDGAGASAGNLITTISAVTDANHVTLAANAGTTVASGGIVTYGTDDGAAVQALINTIVAAGGGTIFFPQGIYIINQTPNANLFALWIPVVGTTQPFVSIELEGAVIMGSNSATTSDPTGGSYLYGMSAPSGGSFLGVIPNAGPAFSFVDLKLKDLALILPQKNGIHAVHAGYAYNFHGENINIDINKPTNASRATTPTNTSSVGIQLPINSNAGQVLLMNSFVRGYYYAAQVYEHANLIHDSFQDDLVGIKENSTSAYHAVFLYGMLIQDCEYGIQFDTEPTYGDVDFEDNTSVQFDLDGGTGGVMGAGFLAVHKGGTNALLVRNLSQKLVYKVDDQVDGPQLIAPIQFASYTFATLPTVVNGLQVYCSDCVSGTFDAAAASGGTGTTVLGENGAWKVH